MIDKQYEINYIWLSTVSGYEKLKWRRKSSTMRDNGQTCKSLLSYANVETI